MNSYKHSIWTVYLQCLLKYTKKILHTILRWLVEKILHICCKAQKLHKSRPYPLKKTQYCPYTHIMGKGGRNGGLCFKNGYNLNFNFHLLLPKYKFPLPRRECCNVLGSQCLLQEWGWAPHVQLYYDLLEAC